MQYDCHKPSAEKCIYTDFVPDLRYLDLQDVVMEDKTFLSSESVSGMDFARFAH